MNNNKGQTQKYLVFVFGNKRCFCAERLKTKQRLKSNGVSGNAKKKKKSLKLHHGPQWWMQLFTENCIPLCPGFQFEIKLQTIDFIGWNKLSVEKFLNALEKEVGGMGCKDTCKLDSLLKGVDRSSELPWFLSQLCGEMKGLSMPPGKEPSAIEGPLQRGCSAMMQASLHVH